jgi:integrase
MPAAADPGAAHDTGVRLIPQAIIEMGTSHSLKLRVGRGDNLKSLSLPLQVAMTPKKFAEFIAARTACVIDKKAPILETVLLDLDALPRQIGTSRLGWTTGRDAFVYDGTVIYVNAAPTRRYEFIAPPDSLVHEAEKALTPKGDRRRQYEAFRELWRRSSIKSELTLLRAAFAERKLDTITTADVERFIEERLAEVSQATANRYRDRLSALFKRAERLGLIPKHTNPVTDVPKFRESGGRIVNLTDVQEAAIREALAPLMRPYFDFALHTGFRWSKQMALRWLDVDVLAETLTIGKDKNGNTLRVPFNSALRGVLTTMAMERKRPDDPRESVFPRRYREPDKFFPRAVERAQEGLLAAGHGDQAARLDGVTWHGLRHTCASRLTMRGVDPRTLQTLGGWRSLGMVERYAHLAPDHLRAAVERLVNPGATATSIPTSPAASSEAAVELARNLPVRHDEPSRVV